MKRTLVVIFLLGAILLSGYSFAQSGQPAPADPKKDSALQKIEFGFKLGVNLQTISGSTWDNSYKGGIVGGITLGMHKKKMGIRAEVLINSSRYIAHNIIDSATRKETDIRAIYLDIPVLFEYNIIPMLKLQIGPQYSNMMSAKSTNGLGGDPKVYFKAGEFSGVLGLEAKLPMHITAGARYILGLTNINNGVISIPSSDSWKNSTIQVYVGYRIQ